MKNKIIFLILFIAVSITSKADVLNDSVSINLSQDTLFSEKIDTIIKKDTVFIENQKVNPPKLYPSWTLYVPGGTHFYDKRYAKGLIFSGLEVGGILYGLIKKDKFATESGSPYSNVPLLIGLKAFDVDKCDYVRNNLEYIQYLRPDFRYDPVSFNDLLKAPFQPKNIFTPITGAFVAVAVAEVFLLGPKPNKYFGDANRIMFMNRYINKNQALGIYGAASLGLSYAAGVSEEYFFRNYLMPVLDYKLGQKKGLIFSSIGFGALHFTNLLLQEKPDYIGTLLQVAETTAAGYFLGRDVQKRNYNIGQAVAAHAWYDFVLMLGSFLVNPQNNYLGVSVQFKM